MSRRGMASRSLVVAVAVLALLELAVRAVASSLPHPQFWPTDEQQTKADQMAAFGRRGGSRVVFVGSSIMDRALDPGAFRPGRSGAIPAYNAALLGASMWTIGTWTRLRVVPSLHPEVVVVGISVVELNGESAFHEDQDEIMRGSRAFRSLLRRESAMNRLEDWADTSRLFEYRKVLRQPMNFIRDPAPNPRQIVSPYGLLTSSLPRPAYVTYKQRFRRPPRVPWSLSARRVQQLRGLVTALRRQHVKVLVLSMPVNADWLDYVRAEVPYQQANDAAAAVARETGASFVDVGRWDPAYFADYGHANEAGTSRFSRLMRDVVLPTL